MSAEQNLEQYFMITCMFNPRVICDCPNREFNLDNLWKFVRGPIKTTLQRSAGIDNPNPQDLSDLLTDLNKRFIFLYGDSGNILVNNLRHLGREIARKRALTAVNLVDNPRNLKKIACVELRKNIEEAKKLGWDPEEYFKYLRKKIFNTNP